MTGSTNSPAPPWPPSPVLLEAIARLRWLRVEFVQMPLDDLVLPDHCGHLWRSVLQPKLAARRSGILAALERRRPNGETVKLWALEPPLTTGVAPAGSSLAGAVVLFGEAVDFAGDVIEALKDFERQGVGVGRHYVPLQLTHWAVSGMPRADGGPDDPLDAREVVIAAAREAEGLPPSGVEMQMLTQTELTVDNRCLRHAPSFGQLLHFGCRRLSQLSPADLPGGLFASGEVEGWQQWAATVPVLQDATTLIEGQRFSRNQARELPLRGLFGRVAFGAPASLAWPWLRLFEQLQLGKKQTHGQGVVRFMPWEQG